MSAPIVAHCPRCKADVTVNDHGRCAYCSRRLLDDPAPAPAPAAPAALVEPWPACRDCGREARRHTVGPYAGLCGTCAMKKRDQMTTKRRATIAQNKTDQVARIAPTNGSGMPDQPASVEHAPDTPAPAMNGSVTDAGPVERQAWELVSAARRVDAAATTWAGLADARAEITAAKAELDEARMAYHLELAKLETATREASAA